MSFLCPECKKSGFEVQVVRLSTYGQRSINLLELDGKTKHLHLFDPEKLDNYES
jgi:hypothetical protein